MQESVSDAIQHTAFAVNNLFQKQHSNVIKPTKRLKSTIESTVKLYLSTRMLHLQDSIR